MARPPRPEPRDMTVLNTARITPNMHRITLGGEAMTAFPKSREGGYVKLSWDAPDGGKRIVRTYTIRSQTDSSIDVDFALHGSGHDSGPATNWALSAKAGDVIKIGGPGPAKPLPEGTGPFLLAGDMTALPAISVNLETLPEDATGRAIILIREQADKQDIACPAGVTIDWVIEPDLGNTPALLANAVRGLPNIQDFTYAWVACEFEAMKLLRAYLRTEQSFGKERLYISSYWKRGLIEDQHKQVKKIDAEVSGIPL